jgi:hypothetical protein
LETFRMYGLTYFGYYIKAKVSFTPVDFNNSSLHIQNFQCSTIYMAIDMQRKWTTTRGTHHHQSFEFLASSYFCSHCACCFSTFSLPSLCPFHSGQSGTLIFVMKNTLRAQHILQKKS